MENLRSIILAFLVCLSTLPVPTFAYHIPVHKDLTQKTLTEYNRLKGGMTPADIATIVRGSASEDDGKRPANHFYDYQTSASIIPTNASAPVWAMATLVTPWTGAPLVHGVICV